MFNVVERPHNTLVPVIAYVTAAIKCIPFPSFSLFSRMKLMRQIQLVMSSEKLRILCFIAYKKNNQLFYGLSMTFPWSSDDRYLQHIPFRCLSLMEFTEVANTLVVSLTRCGKLPRSEATVTLLFRFLSPSQTATHLCAEIPHIPQWCRASPGPWLLEKAWHKWNACLWSFRQSSASEINISST